MKIKSKMKDSNAKSKEWWEVTEEYFFKELEENLAQQSRWKKVQIQIEGLSENLPRFYMWKPNKHRNIMPRWGNEAGLNGTAQKEEV